MGLTRNEVNLLLFLVGQEIKRKEQRRGDEHLDEIKELDVICDKLIDILKPKVKT